MILLTALGSTQAANQSTEQRLTGLESRLERLERQLNSQTLVETLQRMENLRREVQDLRNLIEQEQHESAQLKTHQRELYLDVDQRLQALEGGQTPALSTTQGINDAAPEPASAADDPAADDAPPQPTSPMKATPPVSNQAPASDEPAVSPSEPAPGAKAVNDQEAYTQAFERLKAQRYEAAATAFKQFLADHPQSGYAANAQYWLAEAYYVMSDYPAALEAFERVVKQYPDSAKVADARLKIGFTQHALQRWDQARSTLSEVVAAYPNTTVAQLAENRLRQMRTQGRGG